jgi:hypothetical protein
VDRAANTVPAQTVHDAETTPAHLPFDGATDRIHFRASARDGKCRDQRGRSRFDERPPFCRRRADHDGSRRIGYEAILLDRDVETHEIARVQSPLAWNAVDDFVVDADQDSTRESIDKRWRRLRTVTLQRIGRKRIELTCGDAGRHVTLQRIERRGREAPDLLHALEIVI